jgi:hypothetical protein
MSPKGVTVGSGNQQQDSAKGKTAASSLVTNNILNT